MGVRNQTGDDPQQRHGIDLQVRVRHALPRPAGLEVLAHRAPPDLELALRHGDEAVVLLVHVDVLDDALPEEIFDVDRAQREALDVDLLEAGEGRPLVDDDERAADPPPVRGDVDGPLAVVEVDADELAGLSLPPKEAEALDEPERPGVHPEDEPVEQYKVRVARVHLVSGEEHAVLHAEVAAEPLDRLGLLVRRDVRQEGEVLDEPARLPLGRVGGAEHAPLARLEGAGARDLARLLELGVHACHHAEGADVGEAGEDLGHPRAVHPEPLDDPVPA
mmetsp:Transcript_30056/g.71521  ORF Transcript_30056/g.71521 Transcript_30056/m.71521 type:complete len:277 (-) Transcript_30056:371-1201(-)